MMMVLIDIPLDCWDYCDSRRLCGAEVNFVGIHIVWLDRKLEIHFRFYSESSFLGESFVKTYVQAHRHKSDDNHHVFPLKYFKNIYFIIEPGE